jgi:hypothetical protein
MCWTQTEYQNCYVIIQVNKLLNCHLVGSAPARSRMDLVLKRLMLHNYLPSSNQHLMHRVALFNLYCDMFWCSSAPSSGSVTCCVKDGALNVDLMNWTVEDEHRVHYVQYNIKVMRTSVCCLYWLLQFKYLSVSGPWQK